MYRNEQSQEKVNNEPSQDFLEVQMAKVWTQEQDNILIDNYEQFKELGPKPCFELMCELIPGKNPRQCYRRAKLLKLMEQGVAVAREISQQLFSEKQGDIVKAKGALAMKHFLNAKIKNGPLPTSSLDKHFEFMSKVKSQFAKFKEEEENLLLFGKQEEVADYQRIPIDCTIVLTTRDDFDLVRDNDFKRLLASIDIKQTPS